MFTERPGLATRRASRLAVAAVALGVATSVLVWCPAASAAEHPGSTDPAAVATRRHAAVGDIRGKPIGNAGGNRAGKAAGKAGVPAIGQADRAAIEATIRSQLDAFGRDDAEQAFAYATADIRRQFGSSDHFMRMVEEQYEAVYRAAGLQFLALLQVDGHWVQTVRIVDDEGRVWRALFTMRRQPDRSWKVGGCQLVQTRALAT